MSSDTPSPGENPYAKSETPQPAYTPPANPYQQSGGYAQQPAPPAPPQGQFHNVPPQPYSYQPPAGNYGYNSGANPEAKQKGDMALIMGIIGLIFMPLIFGILALVFAKQAEALGHDAKIAKVLGWVDIALSVLGFFYILFFFGAMMSGASSY